MKKFAKSAKIGKKLTKNWKKSAKIWPNLSEILQNNKA
jgi:hypothetical protein